MRLRTALLVSTLFVAAGCKPTAQSTRADTSKTESVAEARQEPENTSYDGPFGIAQGEPLSALKDPVATGTPGFYKLKEVPQPYRDVDFYSVQATPEHGVCMVKFISNDIQSDSSGSGLRQAADKIKEDLEERYGAGRKLDILQAGSLWEESQYWMMGLYKDERIYGALWDKPKGADERVWRHVQSIAVQAKASDTDTGYVVVEYDFDNNHQCDKDLKHKAARSL